MVVCGLVFASGVGEEFLACVTSSSLVFLSDLLLCEQNRTMRIRSVKKCRLSMNSLQNSENVTVLLICVMVRKRLNLAMLRIPQEIISLVSEA